MDLERGCGVLGLGLFSLLAEIALLSLPLQLGDLGVRRHGSLLS